MNLFLWLTLLISPYDFVDDAAQGLIDAGKVFDGARVCESKTHPELMKMAQEHAQYQADRGVPGHQNWGQRFRVLRQRVPGHRFAEICAESWPWEKNDSMKLVGKSMFESWRQSPGHWRVASRKHDIYGAGMALGENGIWYSCIIVGDD